MIDPKVFERYGMTPEKYKAKIATDKQSEGVKKLFNLTAARIRDGVQDNLLKARLWWAIDRACDVPFYQTAFTLLRGVISKKNDDKPEAVLAMVKDLGLTHMLTDVPCSCGATSCNCPNRKKKLDLPVFFEIFVPLVQAYVKIRWAKIFNDRDLYPVFKYEPVKLTADNMIRSEIITDRIQMQSAQYGYRAVKRQAIFQQLLYSICLQFPMEAWHREEQMQATGDEPIVTKEGLRYALPHPSRFFHDKSHRLDTLNSDTGIAWAGHWTTQRYGEVNANENYWNRDKISYGGSDFTQMASWRTYAELYPCTIAFPERSSGTGPLDRESTLWYYGTDQADKAVVTTELFQKIVPKDYELADYKYPVWHRFVMANDCTNLFLQPIAFSPPAMFYGYDFDGNRDLNAGMGLEILPFQDMVGNYLSQYLLSVKKNLANIAWYNEDYVSKETADLIRNEPEKVYRSLLILPYSHRQVHTHMQQNIGNAFVSQEFAKMDTNMIIGVVKNVLDILERVLVISSQEIGQAASHEQSASEVTIVDKNTGNRVEFTGGFTDDAIYAWKRQLYEAMMAYSSDEVFASVTRLNDKKVEAVKKLGFEVEESDGEKKMGVIGKKSALMMEGIASTRDGVDRINNPAIAATMVQLTQALVAVPGVIEAVGLDQIVDWYNRIGVLIGLPQDFRVTIKNDVSPEKQAEDVKEQVGAIAQEIVNANVGELVTKLKSEFIDPVGEAVKTLGANQEAQAQQNAEQDQAIIESSKMLLSRLEQIEAVVKQIVMPPLPLNPNAQALSGTVSGPAVPGIDPLAVGAGF